MLNLAGTERLQKVVVLNPKGGSGKTTLAFSIAGYLACTGRSVALLDMDQQGSSRRWLQNRSPKLPAIKALSAQGEPQGRINVPADVDVVVIDAPAALSGEELADYTCGMHAILIPVLSSDIDIHAASRLVSNLLLKAQVSRQNGRLGIVANRAKERTIAYRRLMRFLDSLSIKLVGVLRDSQNYVHAAARGRCLHEMTASQVSKDMAQWAAITQWLEDRLATPLTPRDWLRPATSHRPRLRLQRAMLQAAAAVGGLALATWYFVSINVTPVGAASEPPLPATALSAAPVQPMAPEVQLAAIKFNKDRASTAVEAAIEPAAVQARKPEESRWRLVGVVQGGGPRVLVLNDRRNDATVKLSVDSEFDGWSVADSGNDYAVLRQGFREVRLALREDRQN